MSTLNIINPWLDCPKKTKLVAIEVNKHLVSIEVTYRHNNNPVIAEKENHIVVNFQISPANNLM